VDDGSTDATAAKMRNYSELYYWCKSVFLSRNFGHQLALSAGLSQVDESTRAVFLLDGDLQDPPELYTDFYNLLKNGYDVVYGVRKKRKETRFKIFLYWLYYRILNYLSDVRIPLDSGDFSMLSYRVVKLLNAMPEKSRYLRGMRAWLGFKQIGFEYERDARKLGEAKYDFKMLFRLGYDGIFNFSGKPLKILTNLGLLLISLAFLYIVYLIYSYFVYNNLPTGFTSLIVFMFLMNGFIIFGIGILGEYLFRIFTQAQNRPMFLIKDVVGGINDQSNKSKFHNYRPVTQNRYLVN
jgi:dolichol-phosphate mannosyltransferase